MSRFNEVPVTCPSCGTSVKFNAVYSINADRRPDLRTAVIDSNFQSETCPSCSKVFRLDPELSYLDVGRGQWLAVYPASKLGQWPQLQAQAQAMFDKAYGARATGAAKEIGAGLKARLVFGWAAFREKLLAVELGLDDVILELCKMALIRGMDNPPIAAGKELRLGGLEADTMVLVWLRTANEEITELFNMPRSVYDGIVAEPEGWSALREALTDGPFVDVNKLILEPAVP